MPQTVHFSKMHGAGNDYIYVDTTLYNIPCPEDAARLWSDRHKGIGSDGLVLIGPARMPEADFTMRIFNADGSEAMMCGNASRCIGKYVYERGLTQKIEVRLLTASGIKTLHLHLDESRRTVTSVTVDMGEPMLSNSQQLDCDDKQWIERELMPSVAQLGAIKGTFVSMGNPHFVVFCSEIVTDGELTRIGSQLERHPMFPERCNIELATPQADGSIRTRVWERGSGITQACGTGACATAVAAQLTGRGSQQQTIVMDGGELSIEWRGKGTSVLMTGGAEFVYEGEIPNPFSALPQGRE